MAVCKRCHKEIPEGAEYCEDCEQLVQREADESYLDSLLSTMIANTPAPPANRPTIKDRKPRSDMNDEVMSDFVMPKNPSDEDEFEVEDVFGPEAGDELVPEEEYVPEAEEEFVPEAEEEFVPEAEMMAEEEYVPEAEEEEYVPEAEEEEYVSEADMMPEEELVPEAEEDVLPDLTEEDLAPGMDDDLVPEAEEDVLPEMTEEDLTPDMGEDLAPETEEDALPEMTEEDLAPDMGEDLVPDMGEDLAPEADAEQSDDMDDLLDSLFGDEEDAPADAEPEEMLAPDDISAIFDEAEQSGGEESGGDGLDDLFDEYPGDAEAAGDMSETDEMPDLGGIAEDEASNEYDLSDLLNGTPEMPGDMGGEPASDDMADEGLMPGLDDMFGPSGDGGSDDMGDIGGMPDLSDFSMPDVEMQKVAPDEPLHPSDAASFGTEEDLMNAFTDAEPDGNSEEDIELIMDSISSGEFEHELSSLIPEKEQGKSGDKPKKNWFQRLFFNIKEDRTPEEEAARIEKLKAEDEKKKKDAEEAKARKNLSKEEKKAKAEQDKAARAEEAAKAKAEKEAAAREKKEAAALKAKQKKEARLAIEEYEDEGKINKAGATILVVIFAALTIAVIIGTNIYTYNLSIENAQTDFDRQRYNDAYYDVYGLDIKDEDIVLYDSIMTVMYVNKQLNSYNNFMAIGNTDKALDSLLKGLQRYNKYIQLAEMLGIVDDMDYVKNQILDELSTQFKLTEAEADRMIAMEEAFDYSDSVYGLTDDLKGDYNY